MDNHSLKLLERSKPSKVCSHKSTIWREDLVSCNPLSQYLRTPSRPSKRSLTSEVWERSENRHPLMTNHSYKRLLRDAGAERAIR